MLDELSPIFRETLFQARSLYHHICNPNNVKSYSYPHGYSEVVCFTRLIQERREAAKKTVVASAATPAPVVAPVIIPSKAVISRLSGLAWNLANVGIPVHYQVRCTSPGLT
jgi:hypothetical protein